MNPSQLDFLSRAATEAQAANHPWPEMAACEAALESGFGQSKLAITANNLFGMKLHQHPDHPEFGEIALPTREFENGGWIATSAEWMEYPDWAACLADRLATLKRLSPKFPHYAAALAATDAYGYVTEVSKTWSTDPNRAAKVISIYQEWKPNNAPS